LARVARANPQYIATSKGTSTHDVKVVAQSQRLTIDLIPIVKVTSLVPHFVVGHAYVEVSK